MGLPGPAALILSKRYVVGVLSLTLLAVALHARFAVPTGLVRSVYPVRGFSGTPSEQVRTPEISLAFLDEHPERRARPFSVRWQAAWFFPEQQTIQLHVSADDRADVRFDGGLLVRHPPRDGVPATWTLAVGPGSHDLVVEYEQHGGAAGVIVQWAPDGRALRPLDSGVLFPQPVSMREYSINAALGWLRLGVGLLWLAPVLLLAVRGAVGAPAAARRLVESWRTGSALPAAREGLRRWRERNVPNTPREFAGRLRLVAFPALLGPVLLFLVGPHTVYVGNAAEFNVSFAEIALPRLLAVVGLVWLALLAAGAALALVSERLTRIYSAVLFGAGVLVWAQGNLLVGDYGLLTGEELDLSVQAWRDPYEILLWGGVLVAVVASPRTISAVAPLASTLLVAMQVVLLAGSTIVSAGEAAGTADRRAWREPPEKIYQLSRDRNVIHIVLDAFLSDLFGSFLQSEREVADREFPGFVFFADHLGAFRTTRGSMPAMLSGLAYRNERPFEDFQRVAIAERSIFATLARHGYRIHSISFHDREQPPPALPGGEVVRYTIPTPYESYDGYVEFAAAQLIDLSLFRHVPHRLKARVYNADAWLLQSRYSQKEAARRARPSNHAVFFQEFAQRVTVGEDRPVYTFVHLAIPHAPLVTNGDCSYIGQQHRNRATYAAQARCAVTLVQRLLERLRALDVYDRSAIVITSDHGWRVPMPRHPLRGLPTPAGDLDAVADAAMPLLAIKPMGRSGPLTVSYAPTTITDIPATIVDLAGLPASDLPGESVFRLDERAVRPRTFAHHPWGQAATGWAQRYFTVLHLFSVEGRVLDPNAWRFQGTLFEPRDDLAAQIEEEQSGLSAIEQGADGPFRWGRRYVVTYLPAEARSVAIQARSAPGARAQDLTVRLDGAEIGRYVLTDGAWQTVRHALPVRDRATNPYTIELLVDSRLRSRAVMYRAIEWSR